MIWGIIIEYPQMADLNYDQKTVDGDVKTMADEAYTSNNTNLLDVDGTVKKIMTTQYVQDELNGYHHEF